MWSALGSSVIINLIGLRYSFTTEATVTRNPVTIQITLPPVRFESQSSAAIITEPSEHEPRKVTHVCGLNQYKYIKGVFINKQESLK